jgi:hypothetical protein
MSDERKQYRVVLRSEEFSDRLSGLTTTDQGRRNGPGLLYTFLPREKYVACPAKRTLAMA